MSTIEDRLTAALSARADQVRREDLRYAEPPRPPAPFRVPRAAVYTLAAAACAAAVAAPFVLGGGPGPGKLDPAPSPAPPPTPNGADVPGADWTVAYTYEDRYDVDGDGTPDEVVIRTKGTEKLSPGLRRMEVNLSSGGQAAVILDYETNDLTAIQPVELDGGAGDEILYYRGNEEYDVRDNEVGVIDLVDGALADLTAPDPGLSSENAEQDRLRGWWVEDRRLYSYRSLDGGFVPAGRNPGSPPYDVEVWQWRINAGVLQPVPQADQCLDQARSNVPFPCEAGGPVGLPTSQDESVEWLMPAQYFEADVDGDGAEDVIALEGPADSEDGTVEDGEVLLVVSLGAGGELSAPIPAGWVPNVNKQPVLVDGGPGLLVTQEGGDGSPGRLYLLGEDALVEADVAEDEGVLFGNGFTGSGPEYSSTFVTKDGELFTRVGNLDDAEDAWRFHRWSLDGTTLVPDRNSELGCWDKC